MVKPNRDIRKCIVCGGPIWWDDEPDLPPACANHLYGEILDAVDDERHASVMEKPDEIEFRILR